MSSIKVCLDAGHFGGKYNQSPVLKSYYESAMNWKLHLLLKAELLTRGFTVITTRADRDADMPVYDRGAAAKGCDLFISLHSNACDVDSVDYPVVYRAYDNLNDSDALGLKIAQKVGEVMGTKQTGRTAIRKGSTGDEYYGVLRGARAAGVPLFYIVEHSFHTNLAAAKWLSDDANLARLAVAEADILAEHYGMKAQTTAIMGTAAASAAQMALYCRANNPAPQLSGCSLDELAQIFLYEGEAEGVRGDVAFAQSLHETGFFKFGGIVQPGQNNYAGIGALNGNAAGEAATFPDPRTGVRAQIQHLKAYASTVSLVNTCVDPRFGLVMRGCAPCVEWLGAADNPQGKGWAVPGSGYGTNIVRLLSGIIAQDVPQAQAPTEDDAEDDDTRAKAGLAALVDAGVIDDPAKWESRLDEIVTVGQLLSILGRFVTQEKD